MICLCEVEVLVCMCGSVMLVIVVLSWVMNVLVNVKMVISWCFVSGG